MSDEMNESKRVKRVTKIAKRPDVFNEFGVMYLPLCPRDTDGRPPLELGAIQ